MKAFWNPYLNLSSGQRYVFMAVSLLSVLLIWSAICLSDLVSPIRLPAPWKVAEAFGYLSYHDGRSQLGEAAAASMARIFVAFVLVLLVGIPVGVLMGAAPKLNALVSPLIDPLRSAPVVALLPILVMWLGIFEVMKISFLFLGSIVYFIPMVRDAVVAVSDRYWIGARDLGATPWECVYKVLLPIALPRIADAAIVAVSIAWTYVTVAEYVNADRGLGQLIQVAKGQSANHHVFAGIITVIALALLTYQSMQWLKRKVFAWEIAS